MAGMDMFCQFQPIHAIHPEIGDYDIEFPTLELFQCVRAAVGGDRPKALGFQNLATQASQNFVIINK